jgi:hypothetical protein
MTAAAVYVVYIQLWWAVLSAVLLATVLAMLVGVLFLTLLAGLVRRWWA